MSLETAVYKLLSDNTAIKALVSTRVYPIELPQEATLPALSYMVLGTRHEHSLSGVSGLATASVQVDCWTSKHIDAVTLAERVRTALAAYRGFIGDIDVQGVICEGYTDVPEPEPNDPKVYHRAIDFEISYLETGLTTVT